MTRTKVSNKTTRRKARKRPRNRRQTMVSREFADYDRLIRDPCAAPFAKAPYAGGSSGYMHRLQVALVPSFFSGTATVGTKILGNFAYQIQPSAFPGYLFAGATATTSTPIWGQTNQGGTFLSNGSIKGFRPIAACAKWVPTGAIAERAGMISLGFAQGVVRSAGSSSTASELLVFAQDSLERAPNGSSAHEVRFLPTPADETYNSVRTDVVYTGAGTLTVAGVGVDCVYNGTTTVVANGYVEFTMVYEWIPEGNAGLSTVPSSPPPFTSQYYQSTLGDVGHFLLTGLRKAASSAGSAAVQTIFQSIGAMSSARRMAPGQPLLTY